MFCVKNARTCPPKTGPGAAYDNVFFLGGGGRVHHQMRNEMLRKVTKFGDPRSINKLTAHDKPPGRPTPRTGIGQCQVITSEREARREFLLIYTKNLSMSGRPAGRGHAFERLISLEP